MLIETDNFKIRLVCWVVKSNSSVSVSAGCRTKHLSLSLLLLQKKKGLISSLCPDQLASVPHVTPSQGAFINVSGSLWMLDKKALSALQSNLDHARNRSIAFWRFLLHKVERVTGKQHIQAYFFSPVCQRRVKLSSLHVLLSKQMKTQTSEVIGRHEWQVMGSNSGILNEFYSKVCYFVDLGPIYMLLFIKQTDTEQPLFQTNQIQQSGELFERINTK